MQFVRLLMLVAHVGAFTLTGAPARCPPARRAGLVRLGLFDAIGKAFDNKDYSTSPAAYEQTNARAAHILVSSESQCQDLKEQIAAGSITFDEAALKFSSCASKDQGGRLGKFVPGKMVKEFDDVVFGVYDTGEINMGTGAYIYEPKYALDVVHGPVQTKFGWHLIKIMTRHMPDFDFRAKEGAL